jgi:hypothetical protein
MKKNMGLTDKIIRGTIAAVIALMYFSNIISGTLALVLGGFAIVFLITSFISFCPMYAPFGFSTREKKIN